MQNDDEKVELHLKLRPRSFKQLYGQPDAVEFFQDKLSTNTLPHALLLIGDPGTGKTTSARILKTKLGCSDHDFIEMNCAKERGIDMVREISDRTSVAPFGGRSRIFLLDEFHKATPDAMSASLKILEDIPNHVYFFLATSDPSKIIKAIISRCTPVRFNLLTPQTMMELLLYICGKVNITVSEHVLKRIIEVADGSPREGVKLLNKIITLDDEEKQLDAVISSDLKQQATSLAKLLMEKKPVWKEVAKVLLEFDGNPEDLRHQILGYATSAVLKGWGDQKRALEIIKRFQYDFYASKKAGLVAACLEIVTEAT